MQKKLENLEALQGEKDLSKWRDIPCSWMGRFKIAKTTILPKLISNFKHNPNKNSECFAFCFELVKMSLKFIWKNKGEQSENVWNSRVTREGCALPATEMDLQDTTGSLEPAPEPLTNQ